MKIKVKAKDKKDPVGTLVINTVENDDWMKTLPGYSDEIAIHESLSKEGDAREETHEEST